MIGKAARLTGLVLAAVVGRASAPMNYLSAYGPKAETVLPLTWWVLIVSLVVIAIIFFLVVFGAFRRGRTLAPGEIVALPVGHAASGLSWIYVGVGISTVVLLVTVVWTMAVLARVNFPHTRPAFTVQITAHQWWWEAKYIGADPSQSFVTANEIHIPTGVPVLFRLRSADVIHSFWVPPLNGKTDTIPGQTNMTWMDADKPGVYRGQCTEYCGLQHAHMALQVIAQAPADFRAWWHHQLADQPSPRDAAGLQAMSAFVQRCGGCHAVRGTDAGGLVGPDLSHLMDRKTIAAGTLPNMPGFLSGWIADPQRSKPGNFMPRLELTGPELVQIRSYLETLS